MKKHILLLSLVFVILITVTVYAKMTPHETKIVTPTGIATGFHYDLEVNIEKGWNLILYPELDKIEEDSKIQLENIKVGFFYFQDVKSYVEFHPDRTEFEKSYLRVGTRNPLEAAGLGVSSAWIYSDKKGSFKYSRFDVLEYYQISLFKGWNFLTLTHEIKHKSLDEIKGDCVIEKAYIWNPEDQAWQGLSIENDKFPETVIGYGIVLKITNNCQLEKETIPEAPTLPEE